MSSKKFFYLLPILVILLGSCSVSQEEVAQPEPIPTNVISGREGLNGPVLAVKIDDTNNSHPQVGLEDADIIYIEQVEAGLTRLAAIFSSRIPVRVGPVRSARISDLEILAQFGRVAFAYSGAQKKLLPVIAAANLVDLGAQRQSPIIYTTDPNRNKPYAMILRADLLMQRVIEKDYLVEKAKTIGFTFGKRPEGGISTSTVEINWPSAKYSAQWSKEEKRWLLSHNDLPNLSEAGFNLGASTLVIQLVSITPSTYGDKYGGVTPFSKTVGSGKAYVLRNGKRFVATWNRPSELSGTTFTTSDGQVINFAPGQIWVALTDSEPIFTSPTPPVSK